VLDRDRAERAAVMAVRAIVAKDEHLASRHLLRRNVRHGILLTRRTGSVGHKRPGALGHAVYQRTVIAKLDRLTPARDDAPQLNEIRVRGVIEHERTAPR